MAIATAALFISPVFSIPCDPAAASAERTLTYEPSQAPSGKEIPISMPKRMNEKLHRLLLEAVIIRDGDICLLCLEMPVRDKTLDHLNNNSNNNALSNLNLLCRSCNVAENNRARSGKSRSRLLTAETLPAYRLRASKKLPPGSQVTVCVEKQVVVEGAAPVPPPVPPAPLLFPTPPSRLGFGSTEEQANLLMEPVYRKWLFDWVQAKGYITKQEAVNAGAEYLDQKVGRGSPPTTERYFMKAISQEGWLMDHRAEFGQPAWVFRTGIDVEALGRALASRLPGMA